MLNVLSHRMSGRKLQISGTTSYNGYEQLASIRSAYVMQEDILIPTLTVRETLQYSADLRLPDSTSAERHQVVEDVILELGLKDCANTRIGNHEHKGCSGGEKRRTSIGVQLLANPSVLFLDEPTTGLDATSAFQLVRTLKSLSNKGRTIVMTIHQPRSEIWGLVDKLVLLSRGNPVFSGEAGECFDYFKELEHVLPPFVNPAEFLIDLAAVDNRSTELEERSKARVDRLVEAWRVKSKTQYDDVTTTKYTGSKSSRVGLVRQTNILTSRTFKVTYRDPLGMAGTLIEATSMGIITGWIFLNLSGSLTGIRSREAALYVAAALQGYLILLYETYRLSIDIQLFDRERGEGVVGVSSFMISRRLARLFIEDLPVPLIFSVSSPLRHDIMCLAKFYQVIFYFMIGFRNDATQYFTFFSVILIQHFCAVSFAMVCIGLSRSYAQASLFGNLNFTLQSLACAFFVQISTMPVYVRWTHWIAYVFYGFSSLAYNEFAGHFYDCPLPGGESNPGCQEYTGKFILESLSLPTENWLARPIAAQVGFAVAFYIGAGLLLKFLKVEMQISTQRTSDDTDYSAGKEKMLTNSISGANRAVEIVLDKYTILIEKYNAFGKNTQTLDVLKPTTTRFEAGVLNVIMGPSGSGKTTLLNSMALRNHSGFTTRYRNTGQMLVNNAVASEDVIKSLCSYVIQTDDALLPFLTVRETLRFAAGLRLPPWMSKQEKYQRAEQILLKMGLKDCADTLIGSEFSKGISGGEKRRVTIAVQILTEPRVLLLDEPTSGLDAFTASSIIAVLKGLAAEGRTIIATIHQSRSDLFQDFGNVLLLARNGFTVYTGNGKGMLPHFQSLGYECPESTNPADFALDLITVDLQHQEKEAASREKVRNLIDSWNTNPAPIETRGAIATPAELGMLKREMAPFHISFPILLHRGFINFRRQENLIIDRIMQVVGLGIVLGVFFAPLKHNYESVQSRIGFIQEIQALYFVGMLQNVGVYPTDRDVFYREAADSAYSVEAFFMQYIAMEVPFEIVTALLFALFGDLAVYLPQTASLYFIVAYNCFCIVSCGESIGIMFNTLFTHTGFAINVTSVILSVGVLMAGALSSHIPVFLQAWNHLSPLKYSVANLAPYTLLPITFTCTDAQKINGVCPITTGAQVLELYNLDSNPARNIGWLGITTVAYRVAAYLLLKAMRTNWTALARFGFGRKDKTLKSEHEPQAEVTD
jgi:ABC-type multidrug transport system ATPase subunit